MVLEIKEMDMAEHEPRFWYIENTETGECLANFFESPAQAQAWLEEHEKD